MLMFSRLGSSQGYTRALRRSMPRNLCNGIHDAANVFPGDIMIARQVKRAARYIVAYGRGVADLEMPQIRKGMEKHARIDIALP